jgi:hypothetical protein
MKKIFKFKSRNLRKYAFEFLSIFIAVIAAFALNNWNDNRKDRIAESKILTEISNGLELDLKDVAINQMGHETGLMACDYFLNIIDGKPIKKDTLTIGHHYLRLTRDFTSIQNTSGYQTLKSRGFELVKNDSLRSQIIALYEYDYQSLRKIEEEYHEMQFQENYFHEINDMIAPHFIYDSLGSIVELEKPIPLTNEEKKRFKSYLWKIRLNRNFVLRYYNGVNVRIKKLQSNIEKELD